MGFLVSLPLQASGFQLVLKHGVAPGLLYLMPCQHVPEAAGQLRVCQSAGILALSLFPQIGWVMAGSVLAPVQSRASCAEF